MKKNGRGDIMNNLTHDRDTDAKLIGHRAVVISQGDMVEKRE